MSTDERAEAPASRVAVKGPRFGDFSEIAIVLVFVAIVLYLSLTTSTFLSSSNIMAILVATSLIAVVACGQTFVIITGGIDLSSGCGLFNGLSITYLNMSPFIVTLAAMSMARGLAFIIPNGQTIFGFDDAFDSVGGGVWTLPGIGRAPVAGVISLAALVIGAFVLKKTVFGSEVYSVGGNREAAMMAGIPVRRTQILVYMISGALAGLGGVILTGRLDSAQPIAATGLELNAIAAVVIGGASLFGGRGSMLGTILGVLLIGVINNGLTLHNVEPFWVQFIHGAVIFLAVVFDSLNQKRRGA